MPTSIPKDLFDKAAKAVFDGTALSLEHSESVVRMVLDAVDLNGLFNTIGDAKEIIASRQARVNSIEAELAKVRELEAENREQYQIALRAKDERIKELEKHLSISLSNVELLASEAQEHLERLVC